MVDSSQRGEWTGALLGGHYRVGRLIGEGGMGAVYDATREDLGGRRVALKLLHPQLTTDPSVVLRFRREAETAAALGHPNIVQVTDFSANPGEPVFLVMELLSGRSLHDLIGDEGALSAGRVAFIASQTLSALSAAHQAKIVHRDLKPDNIFLTGMSGVRDVVKLLDFGIAKLTDGTEDSRLTRTGAVVGTPTYMSPEHARGLAVDHRTDIYALGVVMYEALSGRVPFEGTSYNALLFAIVGETPPPLGPLRPDLPPAFVAIVERAMARDVAARFPDAASMAAALAPFVEVSVGDAPRPADPRPAAAVDDRATIQTTRSPPFSPPTPSPRTEITPPPAPFPGTQWNPTRPTASLAAGPSTMTIAQSRFSPPTRVTPAAGTPASPGRPSFLDAIRVAFIRPEDDASGAGATEALARLGAQVTQIFRHPVDLAAVERYLAGEGRGDALVIPYFARAGQTGVELAEALIEAGGVPRRILMPTRITPAATVREALRGAIGPRARQVLVVTLAELTDGGREMDIAASFRRVD